MVIVFFDEALDIAMVPNASSLVLGGFYDTIVVRYVGEIGIKSEKVRRRLKDRLVRSIENQLKRKNAPGFALSFTHARIFLSIKDPKDIETVHQLLRRVPGVYSFSYCTVMALNVPRIHERAVALARLLLRQGQSFAVRVIREGTHDFTSQTLARDIGSSIYEALKDLQLRVDLAAPDVTVSIEVRDGTALLFHEKHDGFGGMPRDESSPVLGPVGLSPESWDACQRVIKRGTNLHPLLLWSSIGNDSAPRSASEAGAIVAALNADPGILERMFELLDMQEDNVVRVTVVPLANDLDAFLTGAQVPPRSKAAASILGILVAALVHAHVFSATAGAPRKHDDFKAIVSEYPGTPGEAAPNNTLRWIRQARYEIASMMSRGVPVLPVLFPLLAGVPDGSVIDRAAKSCLGNGGQFQTMEVLLQDMTTRLGLLSIMQRSVEQRHVLRFDMVGRRFMSLG